jgi:Peptidase A4 family
MALIKPRSALPGLTLAALLVSAVAAGGPSAASAATGSMPTIRNSNGWSGYTTYITTNTKGQPTSTEYYVDARWKVPKLDCNAIRHPLIGAGSSVAMWVGLGGVGTKQDKAAGNLVQAGILSRCGLYHEFDDAVYQILPPDTSSVFLNARQHPVKPGDSVEVTVEQHSRHVYSMEINDVTQRWVWAKRFRVSFGNVPDSADYIVEKPGPYQADFGTVTFRLSNYTTFPLGSCPTCGPSFLNAGYAFRFIGINPAKKDVTKVGPLSNPVGAHPGTFSVTWTRGS